MTRDAELTLWQPASPLAPVLVPGGPPHVPDVDHLLRVIDAQEPLKIFSVCLKLWQIIIYDWLGISHGFDKNGQLNYNQ